MSTFKEIAREVSKLLLDSNDCNSAYDFSRWSENDLIHYAKDAMAMIVILKPDWFGSLRVMTLAPGRVQELPSSCEKLIKVIGVHGSVDADSPIASTANDRLGGIFPSKCAKSVTSKNYKLLDYTIERSVDNIFYVNPPAPADGEVQLDIICSSTPELNDEYEIPSKVHNLVIEWMLYRAYLSQEESEGAQSTASAHLNYFYGMISNIKQAQQPLTNSPSRVGRNAFTESN